MIIHCFCVADNLPIKTLVAKQLSTIVYGHNNNIIVTHAGVTLILYNVM